MKKHHILTSLLFTIFLVSPLFFLNTRVGAAELRLQEDNPVIDTRIEDDLYVTGNKIEIQEDVMGDVLATGGTIIINDDIYGDVYVAAGLITIHGNVQGNLVAAGGKVVINGDVEQDLMVAGGMIELNGNVFDDVRITSGQVDIEAVTIGGDLFVRSGNGSISNDVVVENDKDIELGDSAGTSVQGFNLFPFGDPGSLLIHFLRNIGVLIGWILVGLLLFKVAPVKSKKIIDVISERAMMLKSILTGCGVFVVGTISIPLFIILFIIGIGQPIIQLGFSLLGLGITVGGIYASTAFAKASMKAIFKKEYTSPVVPMIIGVSVYQVLGWIPCCLGLLVKIIVTTWGIGGILLTKYYTMRPKAKK